jgi:hypothetical protein
MPRHTNRATAKDHEGTDLERQVQVILFLLDRSVQTGDAERVPTHKGEAVEPQQCTKGE